MRRVHVFVFIVSFIVSSVVMAMALPWGEETPWVAGAEQPRHAWMEWSDKIGAFQTVYKIRAEGRCYLAFEVQYQGMGIDVFEVPCS